MKCKGNTQKYSSRQKMSTESGLCLGVQLGRWCPSDTLLQGQLRLFINPISFFLTSLMLFCFVMGVFFPLRCCKWQSFRWYIGGQQVRKSQVQEKASGVQVAGCAVSTRAGNARTEGEDHLPPSFALGRGQRAAPAPPAQPPLAELPWHLQQEQPVEGTAPVGLYLLLTAVAQDPAPTHPLSPCAAGMGKWEREKMQKNPKF